MTCKLGEKTSETSHRDAAAAVLETAINSTYASCDAVTLKAVPLLLVQ